MNWYNIIWILVAAAIEFVCIMMDIRDYRRNHNKKKGVKKKDRGRRNGFDGGK